MKKKRNVQKIVFVLSTKNGTKLHEFDMVELLLEITVPIEKDFVKTLWGIRTPAFLFISSSNFDGESIKVSKETEKRYVLCRNFTTDVKSVEFEDWVRSTFPDEIYDVDVDRYRENIPDNYAFFDPYQSLSLHKFPFAKCGQCNIAGYFDVFCPHCGKKITLDDRKHDIDDLLKEPLFLSSA